MIYILMRKNTSLQILDFSEAGDIVYAGEKIGDVSLFPFIDLKNNRSIIKWWKERAVPINQNKIKQMLERENLISPNDFLVKNLGLSLTDYYWIKPIDSNLTWESVNLFSNNFDGQIKLSENINQNSINRYSPNASLQGQLEKSWIIENDKRMLVKGNSIHLSTESLNEVFASLLHKKQQKTDFVYYKPIKIKNEMYDYGCICESFCDLNKELVSAYDIVCSEKKRNDKSYYEHFIDICAKHGLDENVLRQSLEYQIMTDFILSNIDRHLNNVGILRDESTMRFLQMAPIFDTGKAFFVDKLIPNTEKELLSIKTESFVSSELKLLSLVKNKHLVDINKLPSVEEMKNIYSLDTQLNEIRLNQMANVYEEKIDLFDKFQHGISLNQYKQKVSAPAIDGIIQDVKNKSIKNNMAHDHKYDQNSFTFDD